MLDKNNNPIKLAQIGALVSERLNNSTFVHPVDHPAAQLYLYPDFISPTVCDQLMALIDADAIPSTLYDPTAIKEGFRTSYSCNFKLDPIVTKIETRLCNVMGIPNQFAETMQGQRYLVGQQFKPHHDFFHTNQEYWEKECQNGGQRTWTAMIFLNEPEEGGHTDFPTLGFSIKPQRGMLLMWNNMNPDGTENHSTLHAGMPVIEGAKYVITKWYRQNERS
jgi:prolyl 4-hydroxylase